MMLERWYAWIKRYDEWRWRWFGKPDYDPQQLGQGK